MLRRDDFMDETKEDKKYREDADARQEVIRVYNKGESDFDKPEEFDEYLEEIEESIDILIYGPEDKRRQLRVKLNNQEK